MPFPQHWNYAHRERIAKHRTRSEYTKCGIARQRRRPSWCTWTGIFFLTSTHNDSASARKISHGEETTRVYQQLFCASRSFHSVGLMSVPTYKPGWSERILGRWMYSHRTDEMVWGWEVGWLLKLLSSHGGTWAFVHPTSNTFSFISTFPFDAPLISALSVWVFVYYVWLGPETCASCKTAHRRQSRCRRTAFFVWRWRWWWIRVARWGGIWNRRQSSVYAMIQRQRQRHWTTEPSRCRRRRRQQRRQSVDAVGVGETFALSTATIGRHDGRQRARFLEWRDYRLFLLFCVGLGVFLFGCIFIVQSATLAMRFGCTGLMFVFAIVENAMVPFGLPKNHRTIWNGNNIFVHQNFPISIVFLIDQTSQNNLNW